MDCRSTLSFLILFNVAICIVFKLASFFVTSGNTYAQLLLSELLGLLGAIASERFRSVSREDSVQPHLTEFDLARVMVKRFFVKDLMGSPSK